MTTLEDRKREIIASWADRASIYTLIETGCGSPANTLLAVQEAFEEVISIEVDEENYLEAALLFLANPRVTLIHGDSEVVLPRVLDRLDCGAVFWLDAHFNGRGRGLRDVPVLQELRAILKRGHENVILVDDLRLFVSQEEGFPSLQDVEEVARAAGYHLWSLEDDIITIIPEDSEWSPQLPM